MIPRIFRILLAIVLPAQIGLMFYAIPNDMNNLLSDFLLYCYFSYLFVGIQSVLYSLIMEFIINKYCNSYISILLSSLLGGLCGLSIGILLDGLSSLSLELILASLFNYFSFIHIGLFVGLLIGIILRMLYLKYSVTQ